MVTYLIGDVLEDQMELPTVTTIPLRNRFVELCDGSDEIDYERCNPKFHFRVRLELPKASDSRDFTLSLPLRAAPHK